jgi:hypothetical protein
VRIRRGPGGRGPGGRGHGGRPQAAAFDAIGARYDEAFPHKEGQLTAGRWLLDLPTAGLASFDAAVAFFSLLMLPKTHIPRALSILRDALKPDGLLMLSMVEADLDDVTLPFLGQPLRLSGYPRDRLRTVVETAGFAVEHTDTRSYEPASPDALDEVQIFLHCRRSA